ncbi:unnamed protein product [Soboliphyme baturini]|uniref:Dystrophin n=1 Tax=Soboliphyme baturini TaxID=241478 RepID=A0A183J2M5_9BILA|nr:unnamed protein product [Soboliphyme baturini]
MLQSTLSTPLLPMTNGSLSRKGPHRSTNSLPKTPSRQPVTGESSALTDGDMVMDEKELLNEARSLRQHKQRLEQRSRILEDHNRQLEIQLKRLRQLINEQQLAGDSLSVNDRWSPYSTIQSPKSTYRSLPSSEKSPVRTNSVALQLRDALLTSAPPTNSHIYDLMSTVQDLGKAMGNLINVVTSDDELSDDKSFS